MACCRLYCNRRWHAIAYGQIGHLGNTDIMPTLPKLGLRKVPKPSKLGMSKMHITNSQYRHSTHIVEAWHGQMHTPFLGNISHMTIS